jgi:hypothetical protein
MILYHFTAAEYLDVIQRDGLSKGDVPLAKTQGINAVWLTTDSEPEGHGLTDGHVLTADERAAWGRVFGREPPPPGARFPNKRAVRITVKIPSSDKSLVHWPRWARKRLEPSWYDALNRTASGGRKGQERTWWLYFGVISPDRFAAVEILDGM